MLIWIQFPQIMQIHADPGSATLENLREFVTTLLSTKGRARHSSTHRGPAQGEQRAAPHRHNHPGRRAGHRGDRSRPSGPGLRIRIHFIRNPIQNLRLNTNPG
jgi:hypothetical protein